MNKNKNISMNQLDNLTNSSVLNLEKLSLEYDNLIKDYNQVSTDYATFLMSNSINSNKRGEFKILKGNSFWGTSSAGDQTVYTNATTAEECQALCSNNSLCSGATFNPITHGRPYCWLRKGNGDVIRSLKDDYAIVPEQLVYLNKMKTINTKMREINRTILNIMETRGEKIYSIQNNLTGEKSKILNDNYELLLKEKENIENTIKEFENLEQEYYNGTISVKQNYMWFVLLFIIAILLIILLVRISLTSSNSIIQQGGALKNKTLYYIFGLFIITMIVSFISIRNKNN